MTELIQRKWYEVKQLDRAHHDPADPVRRRLSSVNDSSSLTLTRALRPFKLDEVEEFDNRPISIVADMKRLSPTAKELPREVDEYMDAGRRSRELYDWGVNVVMINTDEMGWGGNLDDLRSVGKSRRQVLHKQNGGVGDRDTLSDASRAVLAKDIYLHPLQIAAAVESGADGVLLMASVLGPRLADLLDACTIMGTEAVVEVHTPNECEHALKLGAMILCLNNWDRVEGVWRPNQAEAVRQIVPDNVVTLAAGGISSSDEARRLSRESFDSVVLGRALNAHPDPKQLVKNIAKI